MTSRSIALLTVLAVALAIVPAVHAQVPPPPILRTLGSPPGTDQAVDCNVTYDIAGVVAQAPTISCTDGAACDSDGVENGACQFNIKVCVDSPGQTGCTPGPVTKLKGSKFLSILPPLGGSNEVCSAAANQVVVKLKKKGKKPGKKKVKMTGTLASGKDKDKFTLVCNPPSKVCLNGGAGARNFTLANGTDPEGSHFFSSALPGAPVESSFDGSICMRMGTPGGDGVAPLEIFEDSYLHFNDLGGGSDCIKIVAAESSGKLDCNGGVVAVDSTTSQDSGGVGTSGPNGPVTSTFEEGSPGAAGNGYIKVMLLAVTCGGVLPELPGACITGLPASATDCADPTKIDYSKGFIFPSLALTTGKVVSEVTNARQGGTQTITRTGEPLDCATFMNEGPGKLVLALPLPDVNYVNGDTANVAQFDDQ